MAAFTVEVKDSEVRAALHALSERMANMQPVLQAIGEDIMERTKQRFETSTGPDGQRWKPNARATIEALVQAKSGKFAAYSSLKTRKQGWARIGDKKGYFDKDGKLGAKGIDTVMGKKPLIGESKSLSRQFHVNADANSVTVGNSMIYAAIQQFGGQAGRGKKVTIPARPFLPVTASGELYPAEKSLVLQAINDYLLSK